MFRAREKKSGRPIALKVLHRRFAQDQEFVERFRREASSAAGLQHPNVVGVFDRGEHDGTYYIAMEHLPGSSLKDIVSAQAPLPQELVIDLGLQILAAAGFAAAALRSGDGTIARDESVRVIPTLALPNPRTDGQTSLEQAFGMRGSVREFDNEPLTLGGFGQLL